jgi:membrane protein DedA with SNARE-associated domain
MWELWIERYGYWAVFLGSFLEGETILVIAGYSISRGYLDAGTTYLLAASGAALGDSMYYWIGRRFGPRVIRRLPTARPVRARAALLLRRWKRRSAFIARFAYGLRLVLPLLIGVARMRPAVFHLYNTLAALCFAAVYLTLGFLFGEAAQELLGRVRPYEGRILAGFALTGLLIWAVREWRLHRARIDEEVAPPHL